MAADLQEKLRRTFDTDDLGVVSVYVFGSEAEGRAHRDSDLDVGVLNDAPPHLARAIVSRGIRVFCRDVTTDHAFVRTSLLRAADLEPFLRRTRRIKLAAIRRMIYLVERLAELRRHVDHRRRRRTPPHACQPGPHFSARVLVLFGRFTSKSQ
jgi:nucleotidyltransferase-like protein